MDKSKWVFISGAYRTPTRDGVVANIIHAESVARKLTEQGYKVFCPHLAWAHFDDCASPQHFLDMCLEQLRSGLYGSVVLLDNWYKSEGAKGEAVDAEALGLEIVQETNITND